ncbi:cytochrome bd oxidase small subunit CydS [Ureibacillus manganicus]
MNDFMIFVAPFIMVIISIIIAFIIAPMDKSIKEEKQ